MILVGCGDDNDTSTGGDSADVSDNGGAVATDSGGLLLVEVQDQTTVNTVINLRYTIRNSAGEDQAGTLFWDDNTSSRVRGNGSLNHIYRAPGTYRIAIQPDGEERAVVATVVVALAPAPGVEILAGSWRVDSIGVSGTAEISNDGSMTLITSNGETIEFLDPSFSLEDRAIIWGDGDFYVIFGEFSLSVNSISGFIFGGLGGGDPISMVRI